MSIDFRPPTLDQAILCDFSAEGHMGRHILMREIYASRLDALQRAARKHLTGLIDISPIRAGLNAAAFLRNGMASRQAEALGTRLGIETLGLDRFTLNRTDVHGLLLGFAFDESQICRRIVTLAAALEQTPPQRTCVK